MPQAHLIQLLDITGRLGWLIGFKYLGRYVFRTAISNRRLLSIANDRVRFSYKDYRSGKQRTLSLDAVEFIRRFLMHIVPRQFTRIRYYGE